MSEEPSISNGTKPKSKTKKKSGTFRLLMFIILIVLTISILVMLSMLIQSNTKMMHLQAQVDNQTKEISNMASFLQNQQIPFDQQMANMTFTLSQKVTALQASHK